MSTEQTNIPGNQSSGHPWLAVKWTTLGNNQANTHAHQVSRHPWEQIKRTFMASRPKDNIRAQQSRGTTKQSLGNNQSIYAKDILGKQSSGHARPTVKMTALGNNQSGPHGEQSGGHP